MPKLSLYSVVSTRFHPRLTALYEQYGLEEEVFNSTRKVMAKIKKSPPDYLVADFVYGYSNNYAGVNISNLDVMLMTMQRYSPNTKVIVLAQKHEIQHVSKLNDILPLHGVLQLPVNPHDMAKLFV